MRLILSLPYFAANLTVFMCANETNAVMCNNEPNFGDELGFFYDGPGTLAEHPVHVPAFTTTESDIYLLRTLAKGKDLLVVLLQELTFGTAMSKVNGTMTVRLGDLVATVFFNAYDVPLYFNWSMWPK